jgi:hypothetical protein
MRSGQRPPIEAERTAGRRDGKQRRQNQLPRVASFVEKNSQSVTMSAA